MTVKDDWLSGDLYTAGAANAVATAINSELPGGNPPIYNIGKVGATHTLDPGRGPIQRCELTGTVNTEFIVPPLPSGSWMTLYVRQPATGWLGYSATFPGVRWPGGKAPTITMANRVADAFTFVSDGTTIYGSYTQGHIYHPPYSYATPLGRSIRKGPSNPTLADGPNFWTPIDVIRAYEVPELDGAGVTVGCPQYFGQPNVPMLQAYVNRLGIDRTLDVEIVYMPNGGQERAANPDSYEAMLDMCVLTATLPGAKHKVYQGPNSHEGFLDTARRALEECDVVSFSWIYQESWPWSNEPYFPLELMLEFEDMLRRARERGVSFFCASGDYGSDAWQPYRFNPPYNYDRTPWHANPLRLAFPPNCPSAVSVGCTALHLDANGIRDWEEATLHPPIYSSGGRSRFFGDTMCPVVSCFGEFQQGFLIVMADGRWNSMSSTSGSAPLMAAIHARMIQARGSRFDFMDFALANQDAFHDITIGTNGAFDCHPGRDLVTGIGTPNGPALWAALENWSG